MFFISLSLIIISSYLFLSGFKNKNNKFPGFLYFVLIAFSQIVLSFEILSLFGIIWKISFLTCNLIFLACSTAVFLKNGKTSNPVSSSAASSSEPSDNSPFLTCSSQNFTHTFRAYREILFGLFNYSVFIIICFIVFSSYNFILNFIEFSNPVSSEEQMLIHGFTGGFKAWLCNFIKYCFMIFDTSGINTGEFGGFVMHIQSLVLSVFGCNDESFTSPYFRGYFNYDGQMSIISSMLGITGLFAFLPALIKSLKPRKHKKIMFVLTAALLLNIAVLSGCLVFMQYSSRFLLTFVVISSPVIALSYTKKKRSFCKILICSFLFWYFMANNSLNAAGPDFDEKRVSEQIKKEIGNKSAFIAEQSRSPVFYIEKLRLNGFIIDKLLIEDIENYDLNKYDTIIISKSNVTSNYIIYKNPYFEKSKVSTCIYFDKYQNTVDINNPSVPVMALCEIPLEYTEKNNYRLLFETDNYFVLKKKVK